MNKVKPKIYCQSTDETFIEIIGYIEKSLADRAEFVRLPHDPKLRINTLENIPDDETSIYVWGSGLYHGESFFFDYHQPALKIGIDGHADNGEIKSEEEFLEMLYATHFRASNERHEHKVIVYHFSGVDIIDNKSVNTIKREEFFTELEKLSDQTDRLHISVDLDCVKNFPAEGLWRMHAFMRLEELEKLMEDIYNHVRKEIRRADVGGLAEISNVDNIDLAKKSYEGVISKIIALNEKFQRQ